MILEVSFYRLLEFYSCFLVRGSRRNRRTIHPTQPHLQGPSPISNMTEDMSHTMGSRDVNIPSMMDEAWLNSLDEICNVILCEISLDGAGRGVVRTSRVDGVGLMALNSDITRAKDDDRQRSVRLLLVEGLSKTIVQSLRSQSFDLTSSFYKRHLEGVASTTQSYPIGQTLHLKWVRVALQSRRQWDLGQVTPSKGQSKWQRAPVGHGIVFEQCRRLPTVHRAYETIDNCVNASADLGSNNQSRNNDTIVAAEQMCSVLSLDNASNALALDSKVAHVESYARSLLTWPLDRHHHF